jgi:hypothetical protein
MATLLLRRAYVPLASIILVLLVGNWLAARSEFDPLTIAQKRGLRFQTGTEDISRIDDLPKLDAAWASRVVSNGFKEVADAREVLFVGNSQTMAIMDGKPGDLTTPQWLQIMLMRQARTAPPPAVILGSSPGLTMPEFLLTVITAGQWQPFPARTVVGCITLRDWRGLRIRDELARMTATSSIRRTLTKLLASNPDLPYAATAVSSTLLPGQSVDNASDGEEMHSFAVRLELKIQQGASQMPLFKMRSYLRSLIHIDYVAARNRLLGIHTDTPRPVPETTYRTSLQVLELSLRYARSRGINMVLYLSPNRPIDSNPVLKSDLFRFRRDVPRLCTKYAVACFDYTYLVPEKLWTNYTGAEAEGREKDYAHFTGPAHKLVAEQIMADAGARLIGPQH